MTPLTSINFRCFQYHSINECFYYAPNFEHSSKEHPIINVANLIMFIEEVVFLDYHLILEIFIIDHSLVLPE
jgi:hypothetical protein